MNRVNLAADFSRYPAGRFLDDGPFSGQAFRARFLVPRLRGGESVVVELDGTRGYGSSFLEEAFGGLVREGFSAETVLQLVTFESKRASLPLEIKGYIRDADQKSH